MPFVKEPYLSLRSGFGHTKSVVCSRVAILFCPSSVEENAVHASSDVHAVSRRVLYVHWTMLWRPSTSVPALSDHGDMGVASAMFVVCVLSGRKLLAGVPPNVPSATVVAFLDRMGSPHCPWPAFRAPSLSSCDFVPNGGPASIIPAICGHN